MNCIDCNYALNCIGCKYALWNRTKDGKLHPSGVGWCQYPWTMPELPMAFYWITRPVPNGGIINRKSDGVKQCAYWTRAEG